MRMVTTDQNLKLMIAILGTYDRMNPELTVGISIEHVNELLEHKFVTQVGILITITFKLHNFKTLPTVSWSCSCPSFPLIIHFGVNLSFLAIYHFYS